jgi:hypothetical protein
MELVCMGLGVKFYPKKKLHGLIFQPLKLSARPQGCPENEDSAVAGWKKHTCASHYFMLAHMQ